MKKSDFAGKWALITGGSSGIGLAIAQELSRLKCNLLLVSIDADQLQMVQQQLNSTTEVKIKAMDLAHTSASEKLWEYCQSENIDVEILVNNAGFFFFGRIDQADPERASKKMILHMHTVSILCTLFAKDMKKKGRGYILNVSSISAYKAFPGIGYYGGTKAYIRYFTRSLRTELKPFGIHVTCLLPGATATNLYNPDVVDLKKAQRWGVMVKADRVAKAGVRALRKNRSKSIPGFLTKIMTFFSILTPQWVIMIIRKRTHHLND